MRIARVSKDGRIGLAAKAKALIHSERGLREPAGNHCPYDPE